MSLLSALFLCSTSEDCKNALLIASKEDGEALFLYKIWDDISDKKDFANKYMAIILGKPINLEIKSLYDEYLLAVFLEKKGLKDEASRKYFNICKNAEGVFSAECCYRAYKLGLKDALNIIMEKHKDYYLNFF